MQANASRGATSPTLPPQLAEFLAASRKTISEFKSENATPESERAVIAALPLLVADASRVLPRNPTLMNLGPRCLPNDEHSRRRMPSNHRPRPVRQMTSTFPTRADVCKEAIIVTAQPAIRGGLFGNYERR